MTNCRRFKWPEHRKQSTESEVWQLSRSEQTKTYITSVCVHIKSLHFLYCLGKALLPSSYWWRNRIFQGFSSLLRVIALGKGQKNSKLDSVHILSLFGGCNDLSCSTRLLQNRDMSSVQSVHVNINFLKACFKKWVA